MNVTEFKAEMVELVADLIIDIDDDYRASHCEPDDDTPSMDLTIGADADGWSYQTGDNSFTGGAYGYADWAVVYLSRDSDPAEVAEDIIGQLREACDVAIFE